MKKKYLAFIVLLLISTSFVYRDTHHHGYIPVYMNREELVNSVKFLETVQELSNPGKIYYKAPYLYINEKYKGIHIINNSNPLLPVNEGFILAPGCIDIAVKGNIMYLDNSIDLVAFNIDTKQVTKRINNAFPEPVAPDNSWHCYDRPHNCVIVGWKKNESRN